MPFAGYESFEACVRSNSDKDDPEAYCATIQRQVEGESEAFDDVSLEAILEAADSHADELLAEFLQAALAEQEADPDAEAGGIEQQASSIDAITLAFPPGGEVIDHEAGDWEAFLDDLSQHGDVFQVWKGIQRHPEDDLESHDHATFVALEAGSDVTDVEAVLEDHPAVHYRISPETVDAFDRPDGWSPEDSDYSLEPDQQADWIEQQADPMINGHDLDPATGEGVCETTGETIEAETMGELTEDCPHCGEALSVLAQQADQEAESFEADVFRIVQAEDDEMELDGDLMGVGVDFPNAGVYVDWRIDAWPDDEQLGEPHVSDYGSIEDLEQATGGDVENLATIDAVDGEGGDGTDD